MEHDGETQDDGAPRPIVQIQMKGKEAMCCGFSYDSNWLAAGNDTGRIEIYRVSDGGLAYVLDRKATQKFACTTMSFRPPSSCFTSRNVLVSCDVGGLIHHWHATSGKHLGTTKEANNHINAVDFQPTGEKFATGGSDFQVRVYDEATRKIVHTLSDGDGIKVVGHSNRVFAVRWHPVDSHIILSGGWDNTVQIWDLRCGRSVRSIFGPKLCGEALDVSDNNKILTGSWRSTKQLQEWDFGTGDLIRTLEWMSNEPSQVYTAQYGKGLSHKYIVAGGSKPNGACVFHKDGGQALAGVSGLEKAVYSVAISESGSYLAVTTADNVYLYDMIDLTSSIYDLWRERWRECAFRPLAEDFSLVPSHGRILQECGSARDLGGGSRAQEFPERSKRKRDGAAVVEGVAAAATTNNNNTTPPYNGSDVPTWPRWAHPRPDTFYGAPAPYNAYDWSHSWPSHMRGGGGGGGDSNFPGGDFGGFPRAGYAFPGAAMQPGPGPVPPSATPPPAINTSPPRASPPSSALRSDSQSDGSSFSDGDTPTQEADEGTKHRRKRKSSEKKSAADSTKSKDPKGKSAGDENTAKNKRYGIEEVKDLVRFRTELQAKFETMSTHLELWTSIGDKMGERGHPRRQWESYRDKWDIELRRYQKELKLLLSQAGLAENKELEHPEQLVFSDETLQEIHSRLNLRPKAALRSRFQSGVGGARGCLGDEAAAREVAGKRMKKSANNQLLVDSIVDKVVEKIGTFDDTASAQGFKEVLDAVVNLTNVLLAEASAQPTEFEIDNQVFSWLKSIGKDQYASYFAASHVDWTNLLLLDKDDLMEMKIPVGPRKFILKELEKLRPEIHGSSGQAMTVIPGQEPEGVV
ncbi:hypothetical protein SELMODRAFT_439736 [Selaginella moellendorffii]|uniref:SAM domain-containing protein n=1 Tax=Selaginella moellendorffii TaxID=88036 RepID=D8R6V8_SELML|nr:hypothetical protein SELMODRAFT_439736 [Selaginella moellendorffii]